MSATERRLQSDVSEVNPTPADSSSPKWSLVRVPWKAIAIYTGLALALFAFGLIPMWIKANQYAGERDTAQRELRLKQMENLLAAAVIYADRGDYEPARQMSSDFFTSVRAQVDRGPESDLSTFQREKIGALLTERDEVITLLARSDPTAVQRLSDTYVAYRKALNDIAANANSAPAMAQHNGR
jgi:hypothetical protein